MFLKAQLIFSILLSCFFHAAAQMPYTYQNKTHSFKLSLEWFDKTTMWGASDSSVNSITVIRLKDHKLIQKIIPDDNYITSSKDELIFDDFNFDGYPDFKLFSFEAKHGQTGYLFYLFDPKKEKYVFSKQITELLGDATIDKKNKTISNIYREMSGHYTQVVYGFIHGQLVLMEERNDIRRSGENEAKVEILKKKRVKGVLQVVKHFIVSWTEYSKMEDRLMPI